jgi:hypothetical protein
MNQSDPIEVFLDTLTTDMKIENAFLMLTKFCACCEEYNPLCGYKIVKHPYKHYELDRDSMIFLACRDCLMCGLSNEAKSKELEVDLLSKFERYIQTGTIEINYLSQE